MQLQDAARHVSGGGRLTRGEAREAFGAALTEAGDGAEARAARLGALLVALAQRGETREEVAGAADALRSAMTPFEHGADDAVDTCGTGGDGLGTFNLSTAAAFVAAGAGAKVVKHGNRAVSSRSGSADVLEALGGRVDVDSDVARAALEETGFTFLFAPRYHPAMRFAAPVRKALGMPTIFNLLGPLCSPGAVTRQVVGVASPTRVGLLAGVLEDLGVERAYVVHGAGGADELTLAGASRTQSVGGAPALLVDPARLGLRFAGVETLAGGDAAANAVLMRRVLSGDATDPRALTDATCLNAALVLVAAGCAGDLPGALELARESLASGTALGVLDRWVAATRGEVAA